MRRTLCKLRAVGRGPQLSPALRTIPCKWVSQPDMAESGLVSRGCLDWERLEENGPRQFVAATPLRPATAKAQRKRLMPSVPGLAEAWVVKSDIPASKRRALRTARHGCMRCGLTLVARLARALIRARHQPCQREQYLLYGVLATVRYEDPRRPVLYYSG